jgi:hypothetical protein
MDKEIKELEDWFLAAMAYELPSYKELPTVPLYMEQVVSYINQTLKPLNPSDKDMLTSFMVNNYVKADIIKEPEKKKYSEEQLGYLLAITTLKRTLSMNEIALLIEMDKDVSTDKSVLYSFFKIMARDVLQESAKKGYAKIQTLADRYNKERIAANPDAEKNIRDSLGLIALRLSIQAGVNQATAEMLLNMIGRTMHGEKAYEIETTPGHKEKQREMKIITAQSKRLAAAKKEETKQPKDAKDAKKGKKEEK